MNLHQLTRIELARRCRNQEAHLKRLHRCLDGIAEIGFMPGSGIDLCRGPKEIRQIVLTLVKACPITWEKGRPVMKRKFPLQNGRAYTGRRAQASAKMKDL